MKQRSRGVLALVALALVAALGIVSFGQGGLTAQAANGYDVTCTVGTPTGTGSGVSTGTGTTTPGSGSTIPCTSTPGTYSAAPAPAPVVSFAVHRTGTTLHFTWRLVTAKAVRGFNLYSGNHKLNKSLIHTHHSLKYKYSVKSGKKGPFVLGVVHRSGGQSMVPLG